MRFWTILVLALVGGGQLSAQAQTLEARVKALGTPAGKVVAGVPIVATKFIQSFYAARKYAPAWTRSDNRMALKRAVSRSAEDGLLPSDAHASSLANINGAPLADQEIVLTDALARLLYQLYYGKIEPRRLEPNWNFARPVIEREPASLVNAALEAGQLESLIEDAKLKHPFYRVLKLGLARYRQLAARGGWSPVPAGRVLKPGDNDPRVRAIRERLAVTGEHSTPPEGDPNVFDAALEAGVRKFQTNHGLDADGVIGAATTSAMSLPVEARIDQIRGSLERARWVLRSALSNDMIIVNIAGYRLRLFFDSKAQWDTQVIVGKSYTQTPVFTEQLKQIVFNPDWTVPSSIARNEILPKAKADPGYLTANNYVLKDAKGIVDSRTIAWTAMSASNFPYMIVQQPGPSNALGLVKFLFPNKHSVYLHDTPNRELFDKTTRTFSHGCIRVQDPLKLAELILAKKNGWTRAQIDRAVASGKLTNVAPRGEISVLLLYWTAEPAASGGIVFHDDPYKRDPKLIEALNKPV
jgi:murein L,D-transpeptidase YcbB/YkuD